MKSKHFIRWFVLLAGLVPAFAMAATASRTTAGSTVLLRIAPDAGTGFYAVEEVIGASLGPVFIGEGGYWDVAQGKLKWGPFTDALPRLLRYEVTAPAGVYAVSGSVVFDTATVTIAGDTAVAVGGAVPPGTVTRTVTGASVLLAVDPGTGGSAFAVEEALPSGLVPTNITASGTWDASTLTIRWGPFFDGAARTLTYIATGETTTYDLAGLGSFDGQGVLTAGDTTLDLGSDPYEQWRKDMFGADWDNPAIAGDMVDHDGDGMVNLHEYYAGTIPTLRSSVLRLESIRPAGVTDGIEVSWQSVAGKTYTLKRGTNLVHGFGTILDTGLVATPPINTYRDTSATNSPCYFYRIAVEID